mmetsp:Transcript_28743/g.46230  ORF Transcript_28743/g.46230 Transcript_28743/m.46230 type:complete len:81 (-) Transcript_28743:104-346(-)
MAFDAKGRANGFGGDNSLIQYTLFFVSNIQTCDCKISMIELQQISDLRELKHQISDFQQNNTNTTIHDLKSWMPVHEQHT